jgi:hypothetical protein
MTEMPVDQKFKCRVARRADETNIWDVFVEIAPDVPVPVDDPEGQKILQGLIRECVDGGDSWVAVDSDGVVVGYLLAKPDKLVRFMEENAALSLPYVGVSKKWQKRGVFTSLLENLTSLGAPLTAKVLQDNTSNMVATLEKAGFKKENQDSKQRHLRWDPPGASHAN